MRTVKMDELGRIVISREIREQLNLGEMATLSMNVENGAIVIRPIEKVCAVCKTEISGDAKMPLCPECIAKAKNIQ